MALTFLLKLQDMMTPQLGASMRAADSAIADANNRAARYSRNMSSSFNDVRARIDAIRDSANRSTDWRVFRDGTREARRLERELERMRARAEGRNGIIGNILGGAVKPLLAAASVGAAISFGASSIKSAMDYGATSKSYEVLAGNATKGRELAAQLNKLQQDTILGPEVFKAGQTMMSFGISVDKVLPYMKQLGDVSMGNTEKMNSLTLAFSQTQSAGRLMGQDLLQYVNAGFNPLQVMSAKWKEFGFKSQMSVGQLRKAMEDGKITSDMVAKSFEIATSKGGAFADMMETIGQTSYGKMKVMEGQWESFKINIGNALMPIASSAMEAATGMLQWLNISKSAPDTLRAEQAEANSLVGIISQLNEKNSLRTGYINQLFNKYPDLFSNLNRETVTNQELEAALTNVNKAYEKKIGLASHQLSFDTDKKLLSDAKNEFVRNKAIVDAWASGKKDAAYSLMDSWEKAATKSASVFNGGQLPGFFLSQQRDAGNNINTFQGNVDKDTKQKNYDNAISKADEVGGLFKYNDFRNWSKKRLTDFNGEMQKLREATKGGLNTLSNKQLMDFDTSKLHALINGDSANNQAKMDAEKVKSSAERAMATQKTITINIAKMGIDKLELHAANLDAGLTDIERKMMEMLLRVVNAAAGLAAN